MALPIAPPLPPMLAKLQDEIPLGDGWLYEPKWDGFRAIVFRDGSEMTLASRDERPLERYFPELPTLLSDALPKRCVVDGEIAITTPRGLDFGALLLRIHPAASRVAKLAAETPATFIAFDLLAVGSDDLRHRPLVRRRAKLCKALGGDISADEIDDVLTGGSRVVVTPQTADHDSARSWIDEFEHRGLDGVVAKLASSPYLSGQRAWVKVKQHRTADCVVGGYRLSKAGDGVGSLLLGLYDDGGVLQYVGHTSSFKAPERRALLARLKAVEGASGFGHGRTPGGPSRWSAGRDTEWVPVAPKLVCEVAFDRFHGGRFRHASTFLRWRPDKEPKECTLDQVSSARRG